MAGLNPRLGVRKKKLKRTSARALEMAEIPFLRAAGRAFRHKADVRASEEVDPDITERYRGRGPQTLVWRRSDEEDKKKAG
jgi:hypothetical protein